MPPQVSVVMQSVGNVHSILGPVRSTALMQGSFPASHTKTKIKTKTKGRVRSGCIVS